jgi:hypothetical protein
MTTCFIDRIELHANQSADARGFSLRLAELLADLLGQSHPDGQRRGEPLVLLNPPVGVCSGYGYHVVLYMNIFMLSPRSC